MNTISNELLQSGLPQELLDELSGMGFYKSAEGEKREDFFPKVEYWQGKFACITAEIEDKLNAYRKKGGNDEKIIYEQLRRLVELNQILDFYNILYADLKRVAKVIDKYKQ